MIRYVDRSRALRYQACPRARFWEYEYRGRGLRPKSLRIPLTVGLWVHEGAAMMMRDVQGDRESEGDAEAAVEHCLRGYEAQVEDRGFDLDSNEQVQYTVLEQGALIEGLIRLHHARGLPAILRQYEVLEVEQEDIMPLADSADIQWMSRADALLRDREMGELYVYSLKTAAEWSEWTQETFEHDMQGCSEVVAIEHRLRGGDEIGLVPPPNGGTIAGVQMHFLLKGKRQKDETRGRAQNSPFCYGLRTLVQGVTNDTYEYAWSRYWTCSHEHPMRKSKWYPDGMCHGGRNHKLNDNWQRFPAWEYPGGVKAWFGLLASGIQPDAGDALGSRIVMPVPIYRDAEQLEDWKIQIREQERRIARAYGPAGSETAGDRQWINEHFPQYSKSCDYPSKCPFQPLCFGAQAVRDDPLASGYFIERRPHHEPERKQWEEETRETAA